MLLNLPSFQPILATSFWFTCQLSETRKSEAIGLFMRIQAKLSFRSRNLDLGLLEEDVEEKTKNILWHEGTSEIIGMVSARTKPKLYNKLISADFSRPSPPFH